MGNFLKVIDIAKFVAVTNKVDLRSGSKVKWRIDFIIAIYAVVGNNDRHFYNWGVINTAKQTGKKPKFAPIYDSARGLMWNESEINIVNHHSNHNKAGKKLVNYIQNAAPKISLERKSDVNHFELVAFIKKLKSEYLDIIGELVSKSNEERVLKMLDRDIFKYFGKERRELIVFILK